MIILYYFFLRINLFFLLVFKMDSRIEDQTEAVDDLSTLEILDEKTITQALQKRYEQGKYYVSKVLILFIFF